MNNIVTIAAADIYAAYDLAMITPIASDTALTERALTNVFRFTNRDDQTGAAIARYLYDVMGKRRAVLIETETMYGHSMACAFSRALLSSDLWPGFPVLATGTNLLATETIFVLG
ncbi:hypothetical protein [Mesorhizobium sp. M0047]|uniref:hypothetical protein n=1 Tax=Mesorhizobium sp. M0047 TaxID=2956859 RepID=UPI00333A0044